MVFSKTIGLKPLYEKETSTLTYLVFDKRTRAAAIIDPVKETFDRDCRIIDELDLNLEWVFETHVHADHITSADSLAQKYEARIGLSEIAKVENSKAVFLKDSEEIKLSENLNIKIILTPGHTDCSMCLLTDHFLFSGDTLFIRGCGRTDFQNGSNEQLFDNVRNKLFTLDDDTFVLPGHDYKGELFSTIGEEKLFNPRLKMTNSLEDFSKIMDGLNLAYPKKIDVSLVANRVCGKE